ncbi:MAG: ABC transporter ATP-binding protein [Candidatus Microsaccharimonas sp.]
MGTNKNTLKIYTQEVKHHWISFILALVFMPLTTLLLDTGMPLFLSLAIGDIASGNNDAVVGHLITAGIIGLIGALANIIGFQSLLRHEAWVRGRLYNRTFTTLLNKDLQFFVNEKVGALTSRFIDFTRAHIALQDLLIIRTLGFTLSVVVGMSIVATHAPMLAIVLGVLFILVIISIKIFTKIRAPYRQERKKLVGEIHGEVADSITNSLMVKTFAQETHEIKHLNKQLQRFEKIYIKDISIFGVDGTVRTFIMIIAQITGISIAAFMVMNGQLPLAIAIFSLTYLQRIASQIFTLGELLNGYDEALLQAAPMSDILMKPIKVTDKEGAQKHVIKTPTITFDDVSYKYADNDKEVITKTNLTIPAGQKVGLVGHSGAGKTTITHLLLRFFDVTEGGIAIDGLDIRDYTQESLRKQIAYVPQEPMLFHRTLGENITYGKLNATKEEIRDAAEKANALQFIDELPQGLDTLVGERGVKLSGGQRQRIAIARAILKDAPLLILDEATSALDSESERLIQQALEKLMQGRTSIVIAHRLSTIAKLDRIIVMSNGQIAEDGNHQELLDKGGIYAKLWAHQSGGFIEE